MKETKGKTVVVAMSGGVDSSVAAALLVEQGYNVIGVTMKMFNYEEVGGNIHREASCCGLDSFNDARMVAVKLGIPHYILDFSERFRTEVIQNFIDEYRRGRTPNPCVLCNQKIKWIELLKKAESLGVDYIATGHYAKIKFDEKIGRYILCRSNDKNKDQSYALWGLTQEALSKTLFPIGEYSKTYVREIASKYQLKTATKEESFEICFVPDNDYRRFLRDQFKKMDTNIFVGGDIVLNGKIVGKHEGIPFYTIGQRSGIGAYGEKMYVSEIDPSKNIIKIGKHRDILHKGLIARDINLVSVEKIVDGTRIDAMVRYKDHPTPATVYKTSDKKLRVIFDQPKRAITPGQSLVMYDGEQLVGGGIIDEFLD